MRGLEQMEEAEYVALLEKSNYFQVGRYILFYANESSVGSSKIVIEALDSGQLVEIFNATQPIMSLKFSVDKGVIIVNLAEQVGGDWYIGNYYTLDLETGKLTLYELPLSGDGIGYWHWIYYDCHYFVDQRQHELRASDIYLLTKVKTIRYTIRHERISYDISRIHSEISR